MQASQQQGYSHHLPDREVYEPEEAAQTVCHLSWNLVDDSLCNI